MSANGLLTAAKALNPSSAVRLAPTMNLAEISPTATAHATIMSMITIHVLFRTPTKQSKHANVSLVSL